jgi:simple sugar transport system ATP-binding protein
VPPPQVDPLPAGAVVVRLDNVSIDAPSAAARLENLSLELRENEIVGIAGVSGNGQSALFDLLAGLVRPDRGGFALGGEDAGGLGPRALVRRGVGRIPEDRHSTGGIGDMSIPESLIVEDYREPAFARFGVVRRAAVWDFAASIVRDFDVRLDRLAQRTRLLSGGNMQKLILGRVLTRNPRVILANQPTRGLDVGAVAYVHGRLLEARAKGAAVLLISEDLDELLALSDRIAVMHRGRLSAPLPRDAVDIGRLGLMMAGEGMAHAS